jgi:hypothetical protein
MKIALYQEMTGYGHGHKDKPWTRGFTIGSAENTEWFAEIYVDIELSEDRWQFSPGEAEYHRYDPSKNPDEQWP